MPSGVGGGILTNPAVKPSDPSAWVFLNGAWQQSALGAVVPGIATANTFTAGQTFYAIPTINITGSTTGLPAPIYLPQTSLLVYGAVANILEGVAWQGQGYRMIGRTAGGTQGADAATPTSGVFYTMQGYGHDGTSWQTTPNGYYSLQADGLWSGSNRGTYHFWVATPNGSTTLAEWMRLQGANLLIGTTTNITGTGGLRVAGATSSSSSITGAVQIGDLTAAGTVGIGGGNVNAGGLLASVSPTAGNGYATGAGGTVTQATSKATGATLNKVCGTITLNAASLAAATGVGFVLTNSAIAATDVVAVVIKSGATADSYTVTVDAVAAGSCRISLRNVSAGALAEAVVLSYAVIKAVAA